MPSPSPAEILDAKKRFSNSLLFCLEHMAKRQGVAYSRRALTEALPLEREGLTLLLFLRALKRIRLAGEIFQKPLAELSGDFLPCILLLKNNTACCVEKRTLKEFHIIEEDNPEGTPLSLEKHVHHNVQFTAPLAKLQGKEAYIEALEGFTAFFKTLTIRATFGEGD